MHLISVVIPCYNSGQTILKTISSVKLQTWKNIEIIIVDDGSDDLFTKNILKKMRGVKLIHQTNSGLSSARNTGFKASKGSWVLPLDSDDWLERDAIELFMNALSKNNNCHYAISDIFLEGQREGIFCIHYNYFEQLFSNRLHYCMLIRKSLWKKTGGYKEYLKLGFEDWEFNINLGENNFFPIHVNRPLIHYRVSSKGMLLSQSVKSYGEIWNSIQILHKDTYNFFALLKLYFVWRKVPSRLPLTLYFLWFLLHRYTSKKIFSAITNKIFSIKKILEFK